VPEAFTISIAMCTFNGAKFLPEQLDSFLVQARLPDELVVCDDSSADGTVGVLQAFAAQSPFPVRLFINERNLGFPKNFEKAVSLCQGNLIALSDQDDVWLPEKLTRMAKLFQERREIGCAFSDALIVDQRLRPLDKSYFEFMNFTPSFQEQLCREPAVAFHYLLNRSINGALMAFRADLRPEILPIPDLWHHDRWIAFMSSIVTELAVINAPLIKYRQHSDQCYGIVRGDYLVRLRKMLVRDRQYYNNLVTAWESARNTLQARISEHKFAYLLSLDEKITHLRAKAEMPKSRWKRIPSISKEIYSGRYFKYSDSWKNIIKDLLAAM
jgi:glycosyltransferase involved in cell wall biosynthesis